MGRLREGISFLEVGVRGASPGIFVENLCKWCILSSFFADVMLIFIFAVEDQLKSKSGVFDPPTVGGGGGRVS